MNVLVTGAESAKALIATRAIGAGGHRVVTAGVGRFAPAFFSRYAAAHYVYPDPEEDPAGFLAVLRTIVAEEGIDVLIPTHSRETPVVLAFQDTLDACVPFVDYATFQRVNHKYRLYELARSLGLRVPQTWRFETVAELEARADEIPLPAVVKQPDASGNAGLAYVSTRQALRSVYAARLAGVDETDKKPLVQAYVPGDGYGTSVLYDRGVLKALFTHRRLREYPASGGPSTLRVGVDQPAMAAVARRLMDHLGWHGIAMLEFKLDRRSGEAVLLEVNPRFWGSMYTPIVCGVNFPLLLCDVATGVPFAPVLTYRTDVRARFLLLDLLAFPGHFARSGRRGALVRDYLAPGARYDIEAWSDVPGSVSYYAYKLVLQHLS